MCLLAIAWNKHSNYPLIVSANRDEFVARPSQVAHFWPGHPQILAGRDLQDGGTWMGISRNGRFAAVTNIRHPEARRYDAKSRGLLVSQYLRGNCKAIDYCNALQSENELYNGYNFVAFDGDTLVYQSNYTDEPKSLPPGVHVISNATLDTSWPKTRSAATKLEKWLESPGTAEQLARLLKDRSIAPDHELPQTGVALELERMLSAEFIESDDYATRCSTGFWVHHSGQAEYCEISHQSKESCNLYVIDGFLPGH